MTTATAPLRQQTPAAAMDCDVGTLEAALARNGRRLHFAPALEAAYERDTCRARTVRHIVCNLFGTVAFAVLSADDFARPENGGAVLAPLRLAALATALAVVALLAGLCRSGSGRLREVLTTTGTLVVAGCAIFAGRQLTDAPALMQGSGALLIFLHAGIAARLQFRFAVTVNAVTWFGYAAFARADGVDTAVILQNHLLLFATVAVFSTVGNYLLEFRERRNYLLECLKAQRHVALLADAEALRELTLRDGPTGLVERGSLSPQARPPTEALAAIERLSALLGSGLRSLRFPADIECEFQECGAAERRRQLAFLVSGGVALTLVYTALCAPVFRDIAGLILRHLLALSIGGLGLATLNLKVAFGWRIREGIVAAVISVFGLAIVWIESLSQSPTVYSATLGLCLLPMFSSLVAAQPLRFSLAPSLLICAGIATLMAPDLPGRQASWHIAFGVVCSATLYSLIGGYLLELATRRTYLLDRLRTAQLAVLRHHTEHLQRLATVDPRTGLPNRRRFEAELERLAAACTAAG